MVTTNYNGYKLRARTAKEIYKTINLIKDSEKKTLNLKHIQVTLSLNPLEVAHIMIALNQYSNSANSSMERNEARLLYNKLDKTVKGELIK